MYWSPDRSLTSIMGGPRCSSDLILCCKEIVYVGAESHESSTCSRVTCRRPDSREKPDVHAAFPSDLLHRPHQRESVVSRAWASSVGIFIKCTRY